MEDQNRTVTQNLPPTSVVSKNTNTSNIAPAAMNAAGTDSASDSVTLAKSEAAGLELVVVKRGRGRPRKYHGNGSMLSPIMSMPPPPTPPVLSAEKRGRGRPRGSGKLQILASTGGFVAEIGGECFTPHVVIVNTGEDVVSKILSFFQRGFGAVCVISAAGTVSKVAIRQPGASGGVLNYEGCFEILSLSGLYTYSSGTGGAQCKNGTLTVSLARSDGKVFGGGIQSSMIAATPIQLIMATFKQNISKQLKRRHSSGSPNNGTSVPGSQDSEKAQRKVHKLMEGEQSCHSPKSGPMPLAAATPNGVPDNNVIAATTKGVSNSIIHEDLNMNSTYVNDADMDSQNVQPITDHSKHANVDDVNVP